MEEEIISFAHFCRDLFLIINIPQSIVKTLGLPVGVPSMKLSVHEDNDGALILARTVAPKFTLCIKYYATNTIWFLEGINKGRLCY